MSYKATIKSCFVGYVTLAIINTFISLLFLQFRTEFGLSLPQITSLITINFIVQITTDLIAAKYVDKIGYRVSMIIAHAVVGAGLVLLVVLPYVIDNSYIALLGSVICYAIGGGLLEVLVSPIVEACPTEYKEKTMSLLHSFYCWGYAAVVGGSTIFFEIFGIENWRVIAIIWALVPIINGIMFFKVPIAPLIGEGEESMTISQLLKNKTFWILLVLMLCAGASEHAVCQWSSTYAEDGLGISKTLGDLIGPLCFALLMGISRLIYGKYGHKIDLLKFIIFSEFLGIIAVLMATIIPLPTINLLGCALSGFAVGILWPGTFSLATKALSKGGTAMFALMALAGDVGCCFGPTYVGVIANKFDGDIAKGMLWGIIFPIIFLIGIMGYMRENLQKK